MSGSTGFYGVGGDVAPTGYEYAVDLSDKGYINSRRFEGNPISEAGAVTGTALRAATKTATVNTTTTTIAHGLVDENGNATVPVFVVQIVGPAAGDIAVSTQAPDATNIYMSATVQGSYNLLLVY